MEFNHFSHNHGLVFHQMPQGSKILCSGCKFTGLGNAYVCWECNHFLHEQCFQATQSLEHQSHSLHPLTLLPYPTYSSGSFQCNSCNIEGKGFCYTCSQCQFDMHVHCALLPSAKPKDKPKPQNHVYPPNQTTHFPVDLPQNDPKNGNPQNNTYPSMAINTFPNVYHTPPYPPQTPLPPNNSSQPYRTQNYSPFSQLNPPSPNYDHHTSAHPFPQSNPSVQNYNQQMNAPHFRQQNPPPPNFHPSVNALQSNPLQPDYDPQGRASPFPPQKLPPSNYNPPMNAPTSSQGNPPPPNYSPPMNAPPFPPPNLRPQNYRPTVTAPTFLQSNPPPLSTDTLPNHSPNYHPAVNAPFFSQHNSSQPNYVLDQVSMSSAQPNPIPASSTSPLNDPTNSNSPQTKTTIPSYNTIVDTTDTSNPTMENPDPDPIFGDNKGCSSWPETMTRLDHEHSLALSCISHDSPTSQEVSFICDVCKNRMHSGAWVYYCRECDFGTHLECVTSKVNQKSSNVATAERINVDEMKREMELTIARLQIAAEGQKAALDLI